MSLSGLKLHVGVGDLWDVRNVKGQSQDENEASDGQVDPLDVPESRFLVELEKDIGAQHWGNNSSYAIEGLRKVNPDLRILWRSANGNIRIRRGLE